MRTKTFPVRLSQEQRAQLHALTTKGEVKVRLYKRARLLLAADQMGQPKAPLDVQIAEQVGVSVPTVQRTRRRCVEAGLEAALYEKRRSGRSPELLGKLRAQITALACSDPPEGRSRWTLRLLADKLVELAYVADISHMTVQRVLKKTNLSPP